MHEDSGLNDTLAFELPDLDLATELTKRLEEYWLCSIHEDLGVAVVTVFLQTTTRPSLHRSCAG